jgi:sulfonate transport system permease protein
MRRTVHVLRVIIIEAWLPIVVVAAWWIFSAANTSQFFPPLSAILNRFVQVWIVDGGILSNLLPSLTTLAAGFVIAVVVGFAGGVWLGLSPRVLHAVEPELDFLRAIPAVAIVPIAILAIGLGDDMRISVIAFGAVWPVLLNTIAGIRAADPMLRDLSAAYDLPPVTRLVRVRLPAALPQALAGARTSLSIAVTLVVVSEMSGASEGVGFFLLQSQQTFAINDMWTGMIVLGLLGYILNLIFRVIEARVLYWHPTYRVRSVPRSPKVPPPVAPAPAAEANA